MNDNFKVKQISPDDFPPSRPTIRTAIYGVVALIGAALINYWPIIKLKLGL